ncbi:MAG: hypothetical protein K8R77_12760 [Anaerolineaceae bacterium]|nr:hypothetical protein [Anaerolineaceae bacterium]
MENAKGGLPIERQRSLSGVVCSALADASATEAQAAICGRRIIGQRSSSAGGIFLTTFVWRKGFCHYFPGSQVIKQE